MPPRILLATLGSLGDLHPFMALGVALRARGARVTLAAAAEYGAKVERAGLEFRAVRPSFDDMQRRLGMSRAELTRTALARSDFLLRGLIMPGLHDAYEDMLALVPHADMVLTSTLAFGARLAAERRGVPWMAVVLQPLMFASAFDPPMVPHAEWVSALLRMLGPAAAAPAIRFLKKRLERQLLPVHELRRAIGLADGANPLFEGQFSPAGVIGLYSPLLGEVLPDYPAATVIAGFAEYDSEDGAPAALDPALQAFLDGGEPPWVFTLGSLVVNSPGSFYHTSVAAARRLGRRAVLLVGEPAAAPAALGSRDVHVAAYAPHSLLFPRARAVIHQGGIGTLAQALKSGRPQLIVPFYGDQTDNAARAVRLGVALRVTPARYTVSSAARKLAELERGAAHGAAARGVRERLLREDGAVAAAALVLNRLESLRAA